MRRSLAVASLVFGTSLGCGPAPEQAPPHTPEQTTAEDGSQGDLASLRYHTGDVEEWPGYDLPLHHTFDVPKVPPEIVGPFSPEDIPSEP